jgi:1-acyl-sn-glycerol-3-phosphate acyltransferase
VTSALSLAALARVAPALVGYSARARLAVRGLKGEVRVRAQAQEQQRAAAGFCRAVGLRIEVEGAPPATPALVVCNHVGAWDGFALAAALPFAVAAKEEVDRYPVFRHIARTFGVLLVPRGRPGAAGGLIEQIRARLAAGVSVLVFPEGTTGDGRDLLPFKTGAFEAVAGTQWPVLPLAQLPIAWGAASQPVGADALARLAWQGTSTGEHVRAVARHLPLAVRVRIGAPIASEGKDRKQLAQEAQQAVGELLADVQGVAAASG